MGQSRKNRRTDFLVQWKGILETEASWKRDVTLWQFEKEVQAYWQSKSTRALTSAGGVKKNEKKLPNERGWYGGWDAAEDAELEKRMGNLDIEDGAGSECTKMI
ncbi:hypothetical protein VitviT2T_018708 [Vitis vinifera]|uniref:Chromo domain-containing protein n=1 Tax=Vitis vinifera TaxID=29760 RepID=A0ABY9D0C7_VITVI|nr:hypothetical protein VitviT2T_018708 [Vitis vinifera]